ncbi:MAG: 2OG-Fe(II) oxygenase [Archangiaceae bacterium]|nr:2OG-Fe(II) oxygenase [Archangiaceae bacterium]
MTCLQLQGLMTAAECEALIAAAERQGFEATGARYPDGYRNNDRLVRDDGELAQWLWRRIRAQLPALDGAAPLGLNPRFRFCRYRDGQQFTVHRDGAWAPSAAARTRLTVQVYLNEGFEGGATRFSGSGLEVVPQTGAAVVFDHRLWHEGCAVTAGTKYVLRTDVLYPYVARAAEGGGLGVVREVERFEGHTGYVWSVVPGAFSGSRDGTVRRWPGGEVVMKVAGSVTCLARGGDGAVWAGTRAGEVFEGGERVAAHDGAVLAMTALGDGRVASAGADGEVQVGGQKLRLGGGWVWGLCELEPGLLAAGCADGGVRVVDVGRWEVVRTERFGASVHAVARAGVGLGDGRVVSWQRRELGRHGGIVTGLVDLGAGRLASSSEDCTVAVWDTLTGQKLGEGRCDDFVRSVAWEPGQGLLSASYDGTVRRWAVDF